MEHFINVILPIPLEKLFSYKITESETEFLRVGMRVAVPFGKSKIYTGIVHSFHNQPPINYEAKDIHQILDESPIVTEIQLKHWEWIAEYYVCSMGEVMRAALPSGFLLESETIIQKLKVEEFDETKLKDEEFLVLEALNHQSSLTVSEIMGILDKKTVLPIIKSLLEKNLINIREEIFKKYKPKLNKYIKLNPFYGEEDHLSALLDDLNRAPKQRLALMNLFQIQSKANKPVKLDDFRSQTGISSGVIKSLVEKEILREYLLQEDRVKFDGAENDSVITLTDIQLKALQEINNSFKENDVVLLHGITSSGKTEIYIKLIEEAIKSGGQILYLLPEIALTTQLVNRLQDHFGKSVIVYHSRYSSHERFEVWKNVLANTEEARIIIGARSAMLLPFKNLKLVIVDEEHESSFKQFDPAPRYHARDAAIVLASLFECKTLLGSATPSIESYYNTKEGKYGLVNLSTRFNNVLLPEIYLVDMKDKYRRKLMKGHFSDELIGEMQHTLEKDEQIILFQNRRGFAPIVECTTCGHSPQCPNCDVSLTYHQYKNQLRCHYCGYNIPMPNQCFACGMVTLDTKGFGTQQIEQEASDLFPKYKSARMDFDTTRGKYGYEKIIDAFERHEIDILIGTQMVTKGLDFRNVGLVGIMNADNMLNFPDFRAHERSFQMMVQVAGRAGRTERQGKVLIQTFDPYHQILQQVSTNSFRKMYSDQLEERRRYKYPPFYRLVKITTRHRDLQKVNMASEWFAQALRQNVDVEVLGPEFPPVSRVRNQYHKNILLKISKNKSLSKTKKAIVKINNSFQSVKDFRPVRVIVNVDPY